LGLASKEVCIKHRLSGEALGLLIQELENKFRKAMIHPGETVGAIAA